MTAAQTQPACPVIPETAPPMAGTPPADSTAAEDPAADVSLVAASLAAAAAAADPAAAAAAETALLPTPPQPHPRLSGNPSRTAADPLPAAGRADTATAAPGIRNDHVFDSSVTALSGPHALVRDGAMRVRKHHHIGEVHEREKCVSASRGGELIGSRVGSCKG